MHILWLCLHLHIVILQNSTNIYLKVIGECYTEEIAYTSVTLKNTPPANYSLVIPEQVVGISQLWIKASFSYNMGNIIINLGEISI